MWICYFIFSVLSTFCFQTNTASRNPTTSQCLNVKPSYRKNCGFYQISVSHCLDIGCCYSKSPEAPECYYANETFYRTTTHHHDVAATQSSDDVTMPTWLQELLEFSSKKTGQFKKNSKLSSRKRNGSSSDLFVLEIKDELNCQKTYRLYKRINGNAFCESSFNNRISCVEGKLPKHRGESECSACVRLNCCYDPIKRTIGRSRIAPHCFRATDAMTTVIMRSTTEQTTSTTVTSPMMQQAPYKTTRLQALMNMLGASRNQNSNLFGHKPETLGLYQSHVLRKPKNTSISLPPAPSKEQNRFLMTPRPTKLTESFQLPWSPQSSGFNQVIPLLEQNQRGFGSLSNSTGSNPASMLIKYLLLKKSGVTSSNALNMILNNPLNGATDTSDSNTEILNSKKSGESKWANFLQSSLRPQKAPLSHPGSSTLNIFNHVLNNIKSNPNKVEAGENNALFPILSSKVGDEPPIQVSTEASSSLASNDWIKAKTPARAAIGVRVDANNFTKPAKNCFTHNCGHRSTDGQATQRIVGGQWAGGIEYWPWTASLRRTFTDDDRYIHICGATVISRRWILTAAHCFMAYENRRKKILGKQERFISVYAIYVGQYYRDKPSRFSQIHSIKWVQPHPRFDFKSLVYDVAVAKLTDLIWFNNHVQPACLPAIEDELFAGERSWVVGWGDTLNVGSQNEAKLKELPLPLISTSQCEKSWPRHFHDGWICTEGAYLEDACTGDSGGPLVKRDKKARWKVIGIAIAGTRRCSTDERDIKPGIYTKVAFYKDFINAATDGGCEGAEWKHG